MTTAIQEPSLARHFTFSSDSDSDSNPGTDSEAHSYVAVSVAGTSATSSTSDLSDLIEPIHPEFQSPQSESGSQDHFSIDQSKSWSNEPGRLYSQWCDDELDTEWIVVHDRGVGNRSSSTAPQPRPTTKHTFWDMFLHPFSYRVEGSNNEPANSATGHDEAVHPQPPVVVSDPSTSSSSSFITSSLSSVTPSTMPTTMETNFHKNIDANGIRRDDVPPESSSSSVSTATSASSLPSPLSSSYSSDGNVNIESLKKSSFDSVVTPQATSKTTMTATTATTLTATTKSQIPYCSGMLAPDGHEYCQSDIIQNFLAHSGERGAKSSSSVPFTAVASSSSSSSSSCGKSRAPTYACSDRGKSHSYSSCSASAVRYAGVYRGDDSKRFPWNIGAH